MFIDMFISVEDYWYSYSSWRLLRDFLNPRDLGPFSLIWSHTKTAFAWSPQTTWIWSNFNSMVTQCRKHRGLWRYTDKSLHFWHGVIDPLLIYVPESVWEFFCVICPMRLNHEVCLATNGSPAVFEYWRYLQKLEIISFCLCFSCSITSR